MEKIKLLFTNLKSFRWNMWIALCALSLVPTIYQTIRTALAYVNTSASGIDIIGQMEWYDLIDETLKALLIIPLYSVLNKINKENNKNFSRFTYISLIIVFILYFIFNIGVFFYGTSLIKAMNPSEVNIVAIKQYLSLINTIIWSVISGITSLKLFICFINIINSRVNNSWVNNIFNRYNQWFY